jgi:hypothetical protein
VAEIDGSAGEKIDGVLFTAIHYLFYNVLIDNSRQSGI